MRGAPSRCAPPRGVHRVGKRHQSNRRVGYGTSTCAVVRSVGYRVVGEAAHFYLLSPTS